jgi:hypothetical protein
MMIAVFIANLAAARVAARLGPRITIAAGAALAALSCAALSGSSVERLTHSFVRSSSP